MNAFHLPFRRAFIAFFAVCFCAYANNAEAQNAPTSSTRSAETPREITRILRPEVVNRLRDDNVLITQDVRFADKIALQRVARGGTHPSYIVLTRTLPHPHRNAFTLARDIRLQLDVSSNAVVIIATEADGYLGVNCADIEYSKSKQIAEKSALSWTNEGYTQGAAQVLRLVAAERTLANIAQRRRVIFVVVGVFCLLVGVALIWKRVSMAVSK